MVGRQQLLLGLDTGKRKYVAIVLKIYFHTEQRDYIDQSDSICMDSCAIRLILCDSRDRDRYDAV